jgi:hypothetical protein
MHCDCFSWCRTDIKFENGKPLPMTNHHPRCTRVDESLIDVWKVSDGSTHFYAATQFEAETEAENCENITITKVKMHREIFERLPEFAGF